jgi:hypothetical protein
MKSLALLLTPFLFTGGVEAALVAHYGFEEGSGETAFDSANADGTATPGDDGSIVGAVHVPGMMGLYALHFQGGGAHVSLEPGGGNNDILNSASAATFATWIKLDSYPSDIGTVVFFSTSSNSSNSRGGVFISGAGFVEVAGRAEDATSFQSRLSTSQLPLNEWIHLTGVIDYANDVVEIYFGGVAQPLSGGSVSFPGAATSSTDSAASTLGATGGSFEFLNGSLDDVRIYNERLGPTAILAIVPEPSVFVLFGCIAALVPFIRRR